MPQQKLPIAPPATLPLPISGLTIQSDIIRCPYSVTIKVKTKQLLLYKMFYQRPRLTHDLIEDVCFQTDQYKASVALHIRKSRE